MSKTRNKFSPEVRERAVRMVGEHRADYGSEWEAMTSIASKIGCTAETLRRWCREEASRRTAPAALAADDQARLKLLEREVRNCGAPTRSCARHQRILRWRSSTAARNDDVVHRRPS
jgi:transposase-like protein